MRKIGYVLLFLGVVAALYIVPREATHGMEVHLGIAEGLAADVPWGRSVLAGSVEFAPLPSIVLLALASLCRLVGADAGQLYVSLCQGGILLGAMRCCRGKGRWLLPLCFAAPLLWGLSLIQDAGWLMAALFAGGCFNLVKWRREGQLREYIVGSLYFGLLGLCGVFGWILACLGLFGLLWNCRNKEREPSLGNGAATLGLSVFFYCVCLWLLWNWLVLGNPFHFLAELGQCVRRCSLPGMSACCNGLFFAALIFPLGTLLIIGSKGDLKLEARLLAAAIFLQLVYILFCEETGYCGEGGAAVTVTLIFLAGLFAMVAEFKHPVSAQAARMAAVLGIAYTCSWYFTGKGNAADWLGAVPRHAVLNPVTQRPDAGELQAFIDGLWPDSRTVLCGKVLPALYPDAQERRFVGFTDLNPEGIMAEGKKEQLHILVPPPELRLLPSGCFLEDIHKNGADWLFLEKTWPDGWQLYRVLGHSEK